MTAGEARGLMAFWADIDDDYVEEFRKWHNCEHVNERLAHPSFRVGRRYRGIGGAPMFLMSYETADTGVLRSEAYLTSLNNPTPWTRKSVARFRNGMRTIYRLVESAGGHAPTEAPYLLTARFDLDPGAEADWLAWCHEAYLPGLTGLAGVTHARLYAVDEDLSGLQTSERKLHGAEAAGQTHCFWIELASPDLPDEDAWKRVGQAEAGGAGGFDACRDVVSHVFWLDFVMYPPRAGR